jgi:hypothetical protein
MPSLTSLLPYIENAAPFPAPRTLGQAVASLSAAAEGSMAIQPTICQPSQREITIDTAAVAQAPPQFLNKPAGASAPISMMSDPAQAFKTPIDRELSTEMCGPPARPSTSTESTPEPANEPERRTWLSDSAAEQTSGPREAPFVDNGGLGGTNGLLPSQLKDHCLS